MGMNDNPAPRPLSLSGAFIAVGRAVSTDRGERFVRHCAISRRPSFEAFWPGFLGNLKGGKTRRGRHLVTKTQTPPCQFAEAIDLIRASCRIRTDARAICDAIEFGEISGVTRLRHQAARSMISLEDIAARRCLPREGAARMDGRDKAWRTVRAGELRGQSERDDRSA
jgi:hypothetical protein